MGFFKDLVTKNKVNSYRIKEAKGKCRHCNSDNVEYTKHLGWGEKTGTVYHYKLWCNDCKKVYHVKRTSAVYEQVKDQPWIKSSSVKRMEFKQQLF
jgi:late competence protein required for DNA uptake (superfamily II DNA/RNA helicase)